MASPQVEFTIVPEGPFSLRESALFGFGQRAGGSWDGLMRMAFCLDGYREQVGVVVRQDDAGVHVEGWGSDDADAIRKQVARVLSLDHDGRLFTAIGDADPVVRRLQEAAPGLRPPLFYSPYEAATWAVLSARRPQRQMAEVRRKLSEAHGRTFELAGTSLAALPTPAQLLAVESIPGLPSEKVERMHGIARAALDGFLDVANLRAIGPEVASAELQKLRGIGPFYSALIVVRATGFADVLPDEPIMRGLVAQLYGLPGEPTTVELAELALAWRPMRTWVTVLIRVAGPRVLGGAGPEAADA